MYDRYLRDNGDATEVSGVLHSDDHGETWTLPNSTVCGLELRDA